MMTVITIALVLQGMLGGRAMPPGAHRPIAPVVVIDGDMVTGISLPPYGTLCEATPVYGAPFVEAIIIGALRAGEVVQLREQPRFDPRDWVMIAPARWIPLSVVCEAE